jgi:hypothetical protein
MSDDVEVVDVEFLTPARVHLRRGEEDVVLNVSVDLANRKIYKADSDAPDEVLSEMVFTHLDSVNILPEDFFAAGEDIYERASDAYEDLQKTQESQVGGL